MVKRRAAAFAFAAAGLAVACQIVAGIERVEKVAPSGVAEDASPDGGGASDDPCEHVVPPPQPDQDDDRDTTVPPFYLAVRSVSLLGKQDGGATAGYDLDGVCTCDRRPGTFADGGSSCAPKASDCDGDGGADNRGSTLFADFGSGLVDIDEASDIDKNIEAGKAGLLLYVADYNGKPNDREIRVGALLTYGIVDGSGCGTTQGASGKAPPGWCGLDKWTYPQALVAPQTKVPLFRGKGWVNNGVLVFRNDTSVTLFFGQTTIEFGSPIASGRLSKDTQGLWRLDDGVLAGRVPVTDLLRASATLPEPGGKLPDGGRRLLCESIFFDTLKKSLCEQVDINKTLAFDFKPGACDAISNAVTFRAEQADVGEELTEPPADNTCAPDRVAPDLYTCPSGG